MSSLNDFLRLEPIASPLEGNSSLPNPVRPVATGVQWLAAPAAVAGMLYRCVDSTLERIHVSDEGATVVCSYSLVATAVHVAASPDGRLVAVACSDGSLCCLDSTETSLKLRWILDNAHSHVTPDAWTPPSSDRSNAAAASGPVRALSFAPTGYHLLLVDKITLRVYSAATSIPTPLISLSNVTSAAWNSSPSRDSGLHAVVGRVDGSITIYKLQDSTKFESISELGCPSEEDGFACTHLDWNGDSLVAGMCRVIPSEDEPDEDDEDDTAEHEACMYTTNIDETSLVASEWTELGDVVPFFSVPKSGRHVYFTSMLKSSQNLIIVASNVGSDIGTLAQVGSDWELVEFQEGAAATTPTDADDEFTYPVGIAVIQLASSAFRLAIAATDGSLSLFSFENESDPNCFATTLTRSTSKLPLSPVETEKSSSPPELASEPPVQLGQPSTNVASGEDVSASASSKGIAQDNKLATGFAFQVPSKAPVPSPFSAPASDSVFKGGTSTTGFGQQSEKSSIDKKPSASYFGSPDMPAFGSGSTAALTFGSGTSTSLSFGSPAFGSPSPLGIAAKSPSTEQTSSQSSTKGPVFGSTTFGSSSFSTGGGFGALASSNVGSGIFATDQFNAFAKPVTSPTAGMPIKPLFGNSSPFSATKVVHIPQQEQTKPSQESSSPAPATFGSMLGASQQSTQPPSNILAGEKASPITVSATEKHKPGSPPKPDSMVSAPKQEATTAEKKAARVFDRIDEEKSGTLPIEKFADLQEDLGEGFYGDEEEAQIKKIDPTGSGKIVRAKFIDWYAELADGGGDDDSNGSLDTEEREERAEEEEKARECFRELASTENGVRVINVSDMEQLITNLGSTYGEDEFRKVLKKLRKPGDKIWEPDFIAWYIDWLFGGDDSDFEDDSDQDEDTTGKDSREGVESSTKNDLSSLFQIDKDSWKCEVCSVRNGANLEKCAACETVRPGLATSASAATTKTASTAGSIGAGGFSFGATGGGGIGSTGFTFGGVSKPPEKEESSNSGVGFSFSSAAPSSASGATTSGSGFSFGKTPLSTSGFGFGSKEGEEVKSNFETGTVSGTVDPCGDAATAAAILSAAAKKAARAFDRIDEEKSGTLPIEKFADLQEDLGEGFYGDEEEAQIKKIDPTGSGKIVRAKFIDWYAELADGGGDDDSNGSLDTEEREERAEEEEKARECFGELARTENGVRVINVSDMEQLITNLGSTYGEDEFRKVLKKLRKPGDKIWEPDFIAWYIDWLFGGDDSDFEDDSDQDEDATGKDSREGVESSTKNDLSSLFQIDKDSWKCEVCSVRNGANLEKCAACETVRPGLATSAPAATTKTASTAGSIGAGGFSFGASGGGGIRSTGFTFGGVSKPPEKEESSKSGVGFSFSSAAPSSASGETTSGSGFSFGKSAPSSSGFGSKVSSPPSTSSILSSDHTKDPAVVTKSTLTVPPEDAASKSSLTAQSSISVSPAAFPPMSLKAPTPFSGANKAASESPASAAFPPMSSKAPTPFSMASPAPAAIAPTSSKAPTPFSSAKAVSESPASSAFSKASFSNATQPSSSTAPAAFPPMSLKAPTPFSSSTMSSTSNKESTVFGKNTPSPSTTAAFPHLSTKAPTPFSSSTATKESPSNAAFPPMSSKAPTPLSSSDKPKTANAGAAAFPPMSLKAPTPFSGTKTSTGPHSSAAFPPMSSKAPTPFSSTTSKPATTSAAFPPMSLKAPTPFSGTKTATEPHSSAAFPPMSSKAPTPFSSGTSKPATPSAAFPPMSLKAPTPFSGSKTATEPHSSAAFPPMSSKAPTPFSSSSSKPAAPSAAFPPMSVKAPTPFSSGKEASAAPTAAFAPIPSIASTPFSSLGTPSQTPSGSAAFPPMSSTAPTPFSGGNKTGSSSIPATLPSVSSKTPTPSIGKTQPSPTALIPAFGQASSKTSNFVAESSKQTTSQTGATEPQHFASRSSATSQSGILVSKKMSAAETQFAMLNEKMDASILRLTSFQDISKRNEEVEKKLGGLVDKIQQCRLDLLGVEATLVGQKSQSTFLLSRKTDSSRHVAEVKRLVQSNSANGSKTIELAREQPLDHESEQNRRKFAMRARSVHEQIGSLRGRVDLISALSTESDTSRVLLQVMDLYKSTKRLDGPIGRMESKVDETLKHMPLQSAYGNRKQGRSTYGLSPSKARSKKERMRPLVFSSNVDRTTARGKREVVELDKWKQIEAALQARGSEQAKTVRVEGLARRNFVRKTLETDSILPRQQQGRSLLLSPTQSKQHSLVPMERKTAIFSPPASQRHRTAWDRVSSVDQEKLQQLALSLPTDLTEVSFSAKARKKLAAVGTTPEKIQASAEVRRDSSTQQKSRDLGSSEATSGRLEPKAKSNPSNAAFPPMSIKAPAPFSQNKGPVGSAKSNKSGGASYPPMASEAPKPFSLNAAPTRVSDGPKSLELNKLGLSEHQPPSASTAEPKPKSFGELSTGVSTPKGTSEGSANRTSKNGDPFTATKAPVATTDASPNYNQVLTDFYKRHNPSKIPEVAKALEKYKGREVEMFRKLAAKYKVPSPLDDPSTSSSAKVTGFDQSSAFGNSTASPFVSGSSMSSSAMGSSGGSVTGFGSGSAPAPTPFGSSQGSSLSNTTPFGTKLSTNSPFGGGNVAGPSPFGTSMPSGAQPSPFGSTSLPQPASGPPVGAQPVTFQGRNPRDMLVAFYQQRNPQKMGEIDKVLQKYRGNEEQLFRNLAKKYQLDPSVFGLPSAPPVSSFGSPTPLSPGGVTTAGTAAFGAASSPFGGGFGQPSSLGGGPMAKTSGATFGTTSGASFGTSSFGSLASSPSPFGAQSTSGFGAQTSGFGSPQGAGFGSATPFGAPRR